jgi:hypothetical protein
MTLSSRIEEVGGAVKRLGTLVRVAQALDRQLMVSFPEKVLALPADAIKVTSTAQAP